MDTVEEKRILYISCNDPSRKRHCNLYLLALFRDIRNPSCIGHGLSGLKLSREFGPSSEDHSHCTLALASNTISTPLRSASDSSASSQYVSSVLVSESHVVAIAFFLKAISKPGLPLHFLLPID